MFDSMSAMFDVLIENLRASQASNSENDKKKNNEEEKDIM